MRDWRGGMTETTFNIRHAVVADARMLWKWRNEPDVRAASLDSGPIGFDSHLKWFEAALDDPSREILIAVQNRRPIGMVRFDVDDDIATINILLDPKDRSRGFAKQVLAKSIAKMSNSSSRVRATVKADNAASLALFRSLGFDSVRSGDLVEFERQRYDAP